MHSASLAVVAAAVVYHAFYELYVVNWAIQRRAKLSSKEYYRGTDRKEFEARESGYAEIRTALVRHALRSGAGAVDREAVLGLLSQLRGSIFFDESYRAEYDALWIACLNGSAETELLTALCARLRI